MNVLQGGGSAPGKRPASNAGRLFSLEDRSPLPKAGDERAAGGAFGKWFLLAVSVFFSVRYLWWRAAETLNYESDLHMFVSLLLFAAELFGFISVLLFFLQAMEPREHAPPPLTGEPPSVDVLIPIYNEPLDILRRTLIACLALDYPSSKLTLYVLDDGGRAAVAELARHYGANYIAREKRDHAKAGNQNNALRRTRGEFLLVLDTDHIPVRSFLQETIGFFQRDKKMAFVQTPHHFYNPDCYQRNLVLESEVTHEQDLFFQVIQTGRDAANATVFAGSAAVFRRAALLDIGGFRTDCAIEDLHTGMELQARGWHSLYYRRLMSAGLSPEDFAGYLVQRMRWTRGGVQLFFLDNPLTKPGLGVRQRLAYVASLLYFFHAWSRLIYLLAPLSFLLLNCNLIVAGVPTLLWYFAPHYAVSHFVFHRVSREYRSPFWSDVYETASVFALAWASLAAMIKPEGVVFKVTPKGIQDDGKSELPRALVWPHAVLLALLVAGIVKATYHFFGGGHMRADSYALSGAWTVINFILVACAIEVMRQLPRRRNAVRLERSFPAVLYLGGKEIAGRTLDLSETGSLISVPGLRKLPARVVVKIGEGLHAAILSADVKRCRWTKGGETRVGLEFRGASDMESEQIVRLLFTTPDSWSKVRRPDTDSTSAMGHIVASIVRRRVRRRGMVATQVELIHAGGILMVLLEELHGDRAVATWEDGHEPVGRILLRLPHRKYGRIDVQVDIAGLVGAGVGVHTFALKFVAPRRLRVKPILEALESVR